MSKEIKINKKNQKARSFRAGLFAFNYFKIIK